MGSARNKAATYTQTQNKRKQTSMPRVGFEPTIPVFDRAKTFHTLDEYLLSCQGTKFLETKTVCCFV
jgi:hypothetical protein